MIFNAIKPCDKIYRYTVGTHDGVFHADEVMAIAIIRLFLNTAEIEVTRTRDVLVLKDMEYVIDVGGKYEPEQNRFDHHQKGGVEIEKEYYASAGLVWLKYGNYVIKEVAKICDKHLDFYEVIDAANLVKSRLISAIDYIDIGGNVNDSKLRKEAGLPPIPSYSISNIVASMNPHPGLDSENTSDEGFSRAVMFCTEVLLMECKRAIADTLVKAKISQLADSSESVMVMEEFLPWQTALYPVKHSNIKFVVFPGMNGDWRVQKTSWGPDLPISWAGLNGDELSKASGIEGGIFCHNGRFISGWQTRDAAIAAAILAIQE